MMKYNFDRTIIITSIKKSVSVIMLTILNSSQYNTTLNIVQRHVIVN